MVKMSDVQEDFIFAIWCKEKTQTNLSSGKMSHAQVWRDMARKLSLEFSIDADTVVIRDNVVKNRFFSKDTGTSRPPFKACKSSRCLTCPIYKSSGSVMINSVVFNISNKFNCKTDNCIYLAVCKFCREKGCSDNAYVGQTTQPLHRRMNGHRACFVLVEAKLEKSALSLHAFQKHPEAFSLSNFEVTILCQVGPLALDRQESFFIEKFRTNTRGLNRMVVRR